MRYPLLIFAFIISQESMACIVGPKEIPIDSTTEFKLESKPSDFCNDCIMLSASAPERHQGKEFSHGLFTVLLNSEVISRSIHSSRNDSNVPEFVGIISGDPGVAYELTFEYGVGRCMEYKYTFRGGSNGS